jgi:lipopolysaccharide/colanic/teichoic acid biosynthesis glycosyltransferase
MAKRLLDIVVAAGGLVLLSPLLLLIAVGIKIDSAGPVFFRQSRVGRNGRVFRIFKFRTMRDEAALDGWQLTVAGDARITHFGAWLRRTKLDEVAQLIDVLRGTMSLVGPRPEVPRYVALYPADLRAKILSVRPGITDLASIEFRDEARLLARAGDPEREYVDVVMPAKLRFAAAYVDNMSFGTDLRLLAATARALFSRGAGA